MYDSSVSRVLQGINGIQSTEDHFLDVYPVNVLVIQAAVNQTLDVVFVTTIQREIFVSVVYLVTTVTLVKEQLMTVSPVLVPMVDRVYSFPRVM